MTGKVSGCEVELSRNRFIISPVILDRAPKWGEVCSDVVAQSLTPSRGHRRCRRLLLIADAGVDVGSRSFVAQRQQNTQGSDHH